MLCVALSGSVGCGVSAGVYQTIVVDHPDYAWRCHEDCGWQAYSKWRGTVCDIVNQSACRMDSTYNEPYWDQQVSGAFHYNNTDMTWTPRCVHANNLYSVRPVPSGAYLWGFSDGMSALVNRVRLRAVIRVATEVK